ncbi:3-oxoacyl-[acyl-carrier protein] reductase [Pseudonocardia sp. Ae717_Ps2]|uniref:SDR family NAD(P)-dependent oxidoreductase n=1 Tax=Pseudonocardia sp. Ae717_Ps2 TaxID=1885573 RepID=UPI000968AB5C|nr:SDR family oxidoreductase [Pseudonocardia sp. Ae717_Ps2]OLM28561.1 3-oxoacyl-[acyl-carrier protein] reductase [Pseudonocardia sp. Ae717_Ps2]
MSGLDGAFAVVVGGSRGLGAAVAAALHQSGVRTVALSRAGSPEPTPWEQVGCDATDPAQVEAFFQDRSDDLRNRALLVNFAGVRNNAPLTDSDPAVWHDCVQSSLFSTYLALRGFARHSRGPGAVVNMASIHARAAAPGRTAYAAAKAAVEQLTAVAAVELAPRIRVNCIAPGFIATQASTDMIARGALDGASLERRTPLGRLGEVDDITRAALFLLSEDSSFITGETLRVDGGWLRHAEV